MAKEETKKKTSTAKSSSTKTSTQKKSSTKKTTTKPKAVAKKEPVVKAEPKKEVTKSTKTPSIAQEENHFGRTILAALLILVIFVGGYLGVRYKVGGKDPEANYKMTEDEAKFKEEYEKLNGTVRSNGQKNKDVKISKDNNIVYIDLKKAAEILDSGSGVIYFGFPTCPWCRNLVPVLIDAMQASTLDTIYYVNLRPTEDDADYDLRDRFALDEKNKGRIRRVKDAEDAYYDILLRLANFLEDYELTTDNGKKISTGEKRLYAPTVVSVKDGIIVGFHEGTVENHEKDENGSLRDLTKDEETKLFNTFSQMISKYLGSGCQEDGC